MECPECGVSLDGMHSTQIIVHRDDHWPPNFDKTKDAHAGAVERSGKLTEFAATVRDKERAAELQAQNQSKGDR